MKTIRLKPGALLHIETPLGVINIRTGLTDDRGRAVDSISVTPDQYCGERKVALRGFHNTRLVQLKTILKKW